MKSYQTFIFEGYDFDRENRILNLNYSYDGELKFSERIEFLFDFADGVNEHALESACVGLLMVGGASYYKAYLAPQIQIKGFEFTTEQAEFFNKLYRLGLGEFLVRNKLDPEKLATFPASPDASAEPVNLETSGPIVPIGGGKDSLTTANILLESDLEFSTWTVNHEDQLAEQIQQLGRPHLQIKRTLAPELAAEVAAGAYNGHVPISAYLAFLSVVTAVLKNKQYIVLSNEASAGEPNMDWRGIAVNHQYSKTLEFERDFQEYVKTNITPDIRYFSFLRPFSELRIAEIFTAKWLDLYIGKFSSCNRNWTIGHDSSVSWCGKCPKCSFVFMIFAPFLPKEKLIGLFSKNLFADPKLEPTYRQLLGIEGHKPFECVGEVRECRRAVELAKATGEWPELDRYKYAGFDYDYRALREHAMPDEYHRIQVAINAAYID